MLKIGRYHLIRVVIRVNSAETRKRKIKIHGVSLEICCIVEMITVSSPLSRETGIHFENKKQTSHLLEIHGPCFHAFLVLINPL